MTGPRGKAKETPQGFGEAKLTVSCGGSQQVFCVTPELENKEKNVRNIICLMPA